MCYTKTYSTFRYNQYRDNTQKEFVIIYLVKDDNENFLL